MAKSRPPQADFGNPLGGEAADRQTGNRSPNGSPNGNGTDPPLTPLEEWQRMRLFGAVATLKCTGRVIRWRYVDLLSLFADGKIPDHLTAFVSKRVWSGKGEETRSDQEQAAEWVKYLNFIATEALIHPAVSDDPQAANTILPSDLLYQEREEIEDLVRDPAKAALPFPVKQGGDVDAGAEGGQVQPAAE